MRVSPFVCLRPVSYPQLSPIERYAMKFVEETGGQWAADKLRMAEADFEQQKREWEANRQAAQRKAEEEQQLQQQMDEDDYPLTYSSEDAKNQVKAKSNSRTVDQVSSGSDSRAGGGGGEGGPSGRSAKRSSRQVASSSDQGVVGRRTSSGRVVAPAASAQPVAEQGSTGKKSRLSGSSSNNFNMPTSTRQAVAEGSSNHNKSPTRQNATSTPIARRGPATVNGDAKKSLPVSSFVSPGGKQMPRAKGADTSTPIRKVLRARYSSLTVSEESPVEKGKRSGRPGSRQKTGLVVVENGGLCHNNHDASEVINCDEDSNSECSMDVMVDSNDATDSNRTGNDNDSLHSATSTTGKLDEEGGHPSSVHSPRTRSRGSVKINLWTLDESPLPIVRMKPSRLATDSLNASSLVGVGSSDEDEDDRSLEELRRTVVAEQSGKAPVNGGSPTATGRKRKGASVQRDERPEGEDDCKRLTRRASVIGSGGGGQAVTNSKEHNHNSNGPIAAPALNAP